LLLILILTTLVFLAANNVDHITLTPAGYAFTYLAVILGGALYLGLGQMIVGLIKNPETVNSTTRLVYFVFIMVGMFADLGVMGDKVKEIVHWSPYGTVKTMLTASVEPAKWELKNTIALFATAGYALVFSFLGIKWFKWNTK
jgi:ABC-2 type transport system permease protein